MAAPVNVDSAAGAVPLQLPPKAHRDAVRAFKSLSRREQFLIANEVVLTRARELHAAFPDLLGLGFGFKTKRAQPTQAPKLLRVPCVVFTVSRKRRLSRPADSLRRLPTFLYVGLGEPSQRRLCAVPTDVRCRAEYGRPVPHLFGGANALPFGIVVNQMPGGEASGGTLTCAVRRNDKPDRLFGLSCRHVLSRSLDVSPDIASGCSVRLESTTGDVVGVTVAVRGALVASPLPSFDAQFVAVEDANLPRLRDALGGLKFDPNESILEGPEDVPSGFWVATSRSNAARKRLFVWVEFVDWLPRPLTMNYGPFVVSHGFALHGHAREPLVHGDSGAPAVLVKSGSRLIGMYLGGDGRNVYFLPAWQLFNPANYGLASNDGWTLASI
jgi:hypothetical protein